MKNKTFLNPKGYLLEKKDFPLLFQVLQGFGKEVVAPVKPKDKFLRLEKIDSPEKIVFRGIPWYTAKKYVFPERQELFSFQGQKTTVWHEKVTKRVLFGLRMCDLNAFYVNDFLFLKQKPSLRFYKKFRQSLTLVGLWCDKPQDEYCFCDSMDLGHHYDLCLFDLNSDWHLKPGTEKGEKILRKLMELKRQSLPWPLSWINKSPLKVHHHAPPLPKCKTQLNRKDIKSLFNKNLLWHKGAKDCLSCGDCTTLCPTCLCYDIEDESQLGSKCGTRCAKWDSCMFKDFSLVAGGHAYRENLVDRFKHRIFHKLDYFPDQFGPSMCTGCGRCIRGCPTKIDWVSLVNGKKKS